MSTKPTKAISATNEFDEASRQNSSVSATSNDASQLPKAKSSEKSSWKVVDSSLSGKATKLRIKRVPMKKDAKQNGRSMEKQFGYSHRLDQDIQNQIRHIVEVQRAEIDKINSEWQKKLEQKLDEVNDKWKRKIEETKKKRWCAYCTNEVTGFDVFDLTSACSIKCLGGLM